MIPGPDKVVGCPHCEGAAKYTSLLSCNELDMEDWTDGEVVDDLPPTLVKCPHCGRFFRLYDEDDFFGPGGTEPETEEEENAPYLEEPSEEDLLKALAQGRARDPDEETELRLLAWRRRNDRYRSRVSFFTPEDIDGWKENLDALLTLLNEELEQQRILKAEILREKGAFAEAKALLSGPFSAESRATATFILSLCDQKDTRVRLIGRET